MDKTNRLSVQFQIQIGNFVLKSTLIFHIETTFHLKIQSSYLFINDSLQYSNEIIPNLYLNVAFQVKTLLKR